jgi:hypothetical protein
MLSIIADGDHSETVEATPEEEEEQMTTSIDIVKRSNPREQYVNIIMCCLDGNKP